MAPFVQRVVVSTIALVVGAYATYDFSRDFEFIKYTPHLDEEVERRKREGARMSMRQLDTCTLDYKPEAKERLQSIHEEHMKSAQQKEAE